MPEWKRLGFCLVFMVPALLPAAAWLGSLTGRVDLAAWFPLGVLFVALPVLDYMIGRDLSNPPAEAIARLERSLWFRFLTLAALPVQLALLAWSAWYFSAQPVGLLGTVGWLLSQGVVGGVLAINTAHELIHRDSKLERGVGGLLLATVGYQGFKIEHLRGHHVHVATPADPSSAPAGMSLWRFLPRALWRNTSNAWLLERARLRRLGRPAWHPSNELLVWTLAWLLLAAGFAAWLGASGLLFFLLQGLLAAATLEVINYIEHYGLQRRRQCEGRYERVDHHHSWNSDFALSNLLLFQLQRHSDHHARPWRRYPALQRYPDSPQLPGGYAAMFLLALLPPLWFRVIDPRLPAGAAPRANGA